MVRQLLINLITVVVAVFLIAVVAHQFYYRYSPYEECMRQIDSSSKGATEFGIGSYDEFQDAFQNANPVTYRDYAVKQCAEKTHW